ncbi:hypothetical protein ACFS5J_01175 [Flavobacterium chuncheonense]|uniref:YD repeat-containing protein n=1 Tax=Flavobacterium chuncheonense TaxID=2026653 RepID=A0ABW5YI05_9FLAO
MSKIFFLITFLIFKISFSQSLHQLDQIDDLENLKEYKKIIIQYPHLKKFKAKHIFSLKNGKIVKYRINKSVYKTYYHYNANNDVDYQIINQKIKENKQKRITTDTIFYKLKYNSDNQLTESDYSLKKCFSNFNKSGLPQIIENCDSKINNDSILEKDFKTEFQYDSNNRISKKTSYSILYKKIETNEIYYTYDENGNLTQLERKDTPKVDYPIYSLGSLPLYENERFRYHFNKDGIWTKKYWIVEGEEYLIEKRKLVK